MTLPGWWRRAREEVAVTAAPTLEDILEAGPGGPGGACSGKRFLGVLQHETSLYPGSDRNFWTAGHGA